MYSSFEIANFRGISSLALDGLGPVNIITGLNDAGKTTVLEALLLHAAGPQAGAVTVQQLRPSRGQSQLAISGEPENPWDSLFHNFDMETPVLFRGKEASGLYELKLEGGKPDGIQNLSSGLPDSFIPRTNSIILTERSGQTKANEFTQSFTARAIMTGEQQTGFSVEFSIKPATAVVHSLAFLVRSNTSPDLAAGFSALRKRPGGVDLAAALREIDDRIEHLEVLVDNGRAELHVFVGGAMIPLHLLGDGPVAMARYLVAMAAVRNGTLLIDEVGNGVHYTLLPKMWRTLFRASRSMNVQLITTTHSHEALVAASESINDRANDLNLFRLKRAMPGEPTEVTKFSGAKLTTAIDFNTELR